MLGSIVGFRETTTLRLTDTGDATLVALSPDGRKFAFVRRKRNQSRLWIDFADSGTRRPLTESADTHFRGLTFAPLGDALYYVASKGDRRLSALYRVSLAGNPDEIPAAELLIDDVDSPVAISPDGSRLAFVRNEPHAQETAIIVCDSGGLNPEVLATKQRPESYSLYGPAWSRDGNKLAIAANDGQGGAVAVEIDAATGTEQRFGGATWRRLGAVDWSHDGVNLLAVTWDGNPLNNGDQILRLSLTTDDAHKVTKDEYAYQGLSLPANRDEIATIAFRRRLRIWVGGNIEIKGNFSVAHPITEEIIEGAGVHTATEWMPDGRLLCSRSSAHRAGGGSDLWIVDHPGGAPQLLIEDAAMPAVSPDGKKIAFVSARGSSRTALWLFDVDRNTAEKLTGGQGELAPVFSPDGKWLIYETTGDGHPRLRRIPTAGGDSEEITDYYAARPAISPDGHWIAFYYVDDSNTGIKIAIAPYDTDNPRLPLPGRTFHHPPPSPPLLRWKSDSRAVIYCVTGHEVSNLWAQPILGDAPRRFTNFDADRIFSFAWSRDGRHLACARGRIESDAVLLTARETAEDAE
ncbi:MAG: PD40 domain-containing protein [Blastocatellales bacterium]|nr:PD40 domain-containing protein [Blastocatellales bacterium]